MFTDQTLDHVIRPRNCGPLESATHYGYDGIPGDGPYVEIWIRATDRIILEAAYRTYGCPASIASSSSLAEHIRGLSFEQASRISNFEIDKWVGGLPEGKGECADRALTALRACMENEI